MLLTTLVLMDFLLIKPKWKVNSIFEASDPIYLYMNLHRILFSKKVLSNNGFRLYIVLIEIKARIPALTEIEVKQEQWQKTLGLSENSVRDAIIELIALGLVLSHSSKRTILSLVPFDDLNPDEIQKRSKNLDLYISGLEATTLKK